MDVSKDSSNFMAFGFDEGTVVVKIGSDEPIVSMKFEFNHHILVQVK